MDRFRLGEFIGEEPYLRAKIELAPEVVEEGLEIDALARNARDQFQQISSSVISPSLTIPRMPVIQSTLLLRRAGVCQRFLDAVCKLHVL